MHVAAKDLATGREQKMTVTGGSSLPKQDIDRMVREAEQHAEEDRRRKEAAETRNQAESTVYQTEKLLRENSDKIPGDIRSRTEEALADVKEKLKGEDTGALRMATEKATAAAQEIGSALYARAQGESGETSTAGPGPAGSREDRDEGVVDAEIVDDEEKGDAR
jgi:molecular chaperone DnaK